MCYEEGYLHVHFINGGKPLVSGMSYDDASRAIYMFKDYKIRLDNNL